MNMHKLIFNKVHQILGRSTLFVKVAILLRNQARCVIGYHLNESSDPVKNGEAMLISTVAPKVQNFIDVGANVGNWSSLFLKSATNAKGLLFEPSDNAVVQLKKRFEHTANLRIIKAAVSDACRETYFYEEPDAGETSSLVLGISHSSAIRKRIQLTTLDVEVGNQGWDSVDYLKIDTEGNDLQVLRGTSTMLSKGRIGIVQFEYGSAWASAGSTLAAAYGLLNSYKYQIFLLKSTGLFKLNYPLYGEYFAYSNFVAVSPNLYSEIQPLIQGDI